MEISVDGNEIAKTLSTIFPPLFHLHCYRQVASSFTFSSDYFVKLPLLKRLRSIETRKLHVRMWYPNYKD